MPLSRGNIGHCDVALFNAISHLNRFEAGTENPRVGGSIPPLATNKNIGATTVLKTTYAMEYLREHGIFHGCLRFTSFDPSLANIAASKCERTFDSS
jgi:hypothetical protein